AIYFGRPAGSLPETIRLSFSIRSANESICLWVSSFPHQRGVNRQRGGTGWRGRGADATQPAPFGRGLIGEGSSHSSPRHGGLGGDEWDRATTRPSPWDISEGQQ